MKKMLGFLLTVLLSFFLGFWLSEHHVLQGTKVGTFLTTVVDSVPVPEKWLQENSVPIESNDLTTDAFKDKLNDSSHPSQGDGLNNAINYEIVENEIFRLLNELREKQNLPPLSKNDILKKAADQRALETEELFSHTRPDGSESFTVLKEADHNYDYRLAGENLAMSTYHRSEENMADVIFNGWVESEGHYENMIHPDFQEVGIGIHFGGEIIYATQIFGKPF